MNAAIFACLFASPAFADGVDKMYDAREGYIDELEIIGDVVLDGESYALFEMRNMQMQFFIPPDAAYISEDAANPIIANNQVFEGGRTSTAAAGDERWQDCPGDPVYDHNGVPRQVYGDLTSTYTHMEGADAFYKLGLGHCEDEVEDWAWNNPLFELPSEDAPMEICGNERDQTLRALGCSDVISNPLASLDNVGWAYWSRAYVRCGDAPVSDVISDLMSAARLDPVQWQEYFQRASGYEGPMDGQVNFQLYGAASRWANQGCR